MKIDEVARIGTTLAAGSHGVVTAGELRKADVDLSAVARLVRRGTWTHLWRGMYVTDAHPASPLTLAHAAVKHAEAQHRDARRAPGAVVTGLAGAQAFGLRWVPATGRVHVLVGPAVQRRSNAQVLVRRAHDVSTTPTWSWGGVPVAYPARLVVDAARECTSLQDVRGLVLAAVADRHASPEDMLALLDSGAVGGTAWARRAVRDAERGAASPPEAELVDDLLGWGKPFYVNAEVHVDGRLIAIPDVYLVGTGVGAELDSKERHGAADALDDTLLRHQRASDHGLCLLHSTPHRYRTDPAALRRRLLQAVADRRSRGLSEPPGLVVVPRGPLLR